MVILAPIWVILVPLVEAVNESAKLLVIAPVLSVVANVTVTIEVSGTRANMGEVFAGMSFSNYKININHLLWKEECLNWKDQNHLLNRLKQKLFL